MRPRISVIIPAYNEEETIGKVIDGIKTHLNKHSEILVIDDGSTDNTSKIAKLKGAKVLKNEKNIGYIGSVNRVIPLLKGEIIVTIDADGELDSKYIPRFIESMKNYDILIGRRDKIPRFMERVISSITNKKMGISDAFCGLRTIKKEVFDDLKTFDRSNSFGLDFLLRAHEKQYKMGEIPIESVNPRKNPRVGGSFKVNAKLLWLLARMLTRLF